MSLGALFLVWVLDWLRVHRVWTGLWRARLELRVLGLKLTDALLEQLVHCKEAYFASVGFSVRTSN